MAIMFEDQAEIPQGSARHPGFKAGPAKLPDDMSDALGPIEAVTPWGITANPEPDPKPDREPIEPESVWYSAASDPLGFASAWYDEFTGDFASDDPVSGAVEATGKGFGTMGRSLWHGIAGEDAELPSSQSVGIGAGAIALVGLVALIWWIVR